MNRLFFYVVDVFIGMTFNPPGNYMTNDTHCSDVETGTEAGTNFATTESLGTQ